MNAAQLMSLNVKCIDEETPIGAAWSTMQSLHVRHLPVVESGKLVGLVSDRDLLLRARRDLDGTLAFPELCAAEVMAFRPISCTPSAEAREIAAEMVERNIDAMPVVSPGGDVVGIVTSKDLLKVLAEQV